MPHQLGCKIKFLVKLNSCNPNELHVGGGEKKAPVKGGGEKVPVRI